MTRFRPWFHGPGPVSIAPPEDMPPRPQERRPPDPHENRWSMSGPVNQRFDPCGAPPLAIRKRDRR